MGTTAQKLQRVLDTKEGLKDTINTYLGQDITSAIPFKDYETYIKNFYGSLPKTDYAEGSNITLSNTLKGKLDFENGIVGIGDTKQDTRQGYNLLPMVNTTQIINGVTFTPQANGSVLVNGTATNNAIYPLNSNGTQAVSNISLPAGSYVALDSVGNYTDYFIQVTNGTVFANTGSSGTVGKSPTVTTTETTDFRAMIYVRSGKTLNNVLFKPMIVKATDVNKDYEQYGASPSPSYPQDIEVVRGKNRLNNTLTNTTQQGIEFIVNEDKTIKVNGTATGTSGVVIGQVQLTANETYTLSGCASNGGSGKYTLSVSPNGETTRLVDDTGSGVTYTPTTSGIYDIRLNYWYGFNIQNLTFKPMIEERKCSYFLSTL